MSEKVSIVLGAPGLTLLSLDITERQTALPNVPGGSQGWGSATSPELRL